MGSFWWAARFDGHDLGTLPRFRPGNGARQAFYREDPSGPTITLPRRYRTTAVVLHELTHWALTGEGDIPHHGRTFARLLLELTREFAGGITADALADAYAQHRVHVGRPPRRGPDGAYHYPWDERLYLGRGRVVTIHHGCGPVATGVTRGVLVRRARGVLTLEGARLARVPERDVWKVERLAS